VAADPSGEPTHIEETVRAIADLQAEHYDSATAPQRIVDRLTDLMGRPIFIVVLTVVVGGWISLNLGAGWFGYRPVDPPPFAGLEIFCSLASLFMVVFVLITQRREQQFVGRQALLALEMALLNEQKAAKIIALLEEFRRDSPIRDRADASADAMAVPADPKVVLDAIDSGRTAAPVREVDPPERTRRAAQSKPREAC
jgi:uncharacterized membrane protein